MNSRYIMIDSKPIHIVLRVDKDDVEYSESYSLEIKDYIWWSYQTKKEGKAPIADFKIKLLSRNINRFKSNLVYFCDDNGEYVKKAKLFVIENKGIKSEEIDHHVPKGWGGEADMWLKCGEFEDGNFNNLKSLVYHSNPRKTYLNLNQSRNLYPFWNQNPVTLVITKK